MIRRDPRMMGLPSIPTDTDEAKLLFAALRAGEERLGCSSDDVLPIEIGPNGSGAWTLPVDDRYVIWVWTTGGHISNSMWQDTSNFGGGRFAVTLRHEVRVFSAVSSAFEDWVLGPFCSVDAVDAVHWAIDSTLNPLDTARQRTLRLNEIRTLQRKQCKPAEPEPRSQSEDRLKKKKVSDVRNRLTQTGRPRKGNKKR